MAKVRSMGTYLQSDVDPGFEIFHLKIAAVIFDNSGERAQIPLHLFVLQDDMAESKDLL